TDWGIIYSCPAFVDKLVKERYSRLFGILLKDRERFRIPDRPGTGSVGMTEKCFLRVSTTSVFVVF
ncbi:hypothetical protein M1N60_01885, partial [Thermodesulfovibrionales bacterium]|nr:hypothetical protein [Thermodesulfovibrionales bacterium]